jgi:glucose-6-phosphate 1-dehydrogenase
VRGQFVGYRQEQGVSAHSHVETYAALKLEIHSWRWQGVPFFIRAGKCMPVTCTEVTAEFRRPPAVWTNKRPPRNQLRFRIQPDIAIGLEASTKTPGEEMVGEAIELLAAHRPQGDEMDAYERLLGDAMRGDQSLFAREDYVEAAWRVVEPVLGDATPIHFYEPESWGPPEAERLIAPAHWKDPVVDGSASK